MANIDNLKRQHVEIMELINNVQELVKGGDFENTAFELAKYINTLSGKLKIHLGAEDEFLYPGLLKSQDEKIRKTAELYITEMGNLFEVFAKFKERYNTRNKILNCRNEFKSDCNSIFSSVKERILRENGQLYTLLK